MRRLLSLPTGAGFLWAECGDSTASSKEEAAAAIEETTREWAAASPWGMPLVRPSS